MYRTFLNPISELQQMIDFMDRALTTRGTVSNQSRQSGEPVYTLPVDIWQKDNVCYLRAAVPGIQPEQLDIQFQDGVLTISGETTLEAAQDENVNVWRREYSYGKFVRAVRLPDFAIAEKIEANFENGFVTISVPLAIQSPKTLRVPVKSGGESKTSALTQDTETSAENEAASTN